MEVNDGCGGCAGLCLMALGIIMIAAGLAIGIELSPVIHIASCSARAAANEDCRQYIHNVTGGYGIIRAIGVTAGIVSFIVGWILTEVEG